MHFDLSPSTETTWLIVILFYFAHQLSFFCIQYEKATLETTSSLQPWQILEFWSIRTIHINLNSSHQVDSWFLMVAEKKCDKIGTFPREIFYLVIKQDIRLYIQIKTSFFGSFGAMTILHANIIPTLFIFWVLVPRNLFFSQVDYLHSISQNLDYWTPTFIVIQYLRSPFPFTDLSCFSHHKRTDNWMITNNTWTNEKPPCDTEMVWFFLDLSI